MSTCWQLRIGFISFLQLKLLYQKGPLRMLRPLCAKSLAPPLVVRDGSNSVRVGVLLPDVCTLLWGRIPSSRPQETAPCTGRQIGAARGRHRMNVSIQSQSNKK